MTIRQPHPDLAAEAAARSREAFDNVYRCIALGMHEPTLALPMVGAAAWCAGVGFALSGVGVVASLFAAPPVGAEPNTPA